VTAGQSIMSNQPVVSIVTPSYNSAKFIKRCIESVFAQEYPKVEHIVQDGASTDGTVDILSKYGGRVDWASEPDCGQPEGLDRALKRSRGDIILVLNADDLLLPNAASWAVENMGKYPEAAVVYGDEYIINEDEEIIGVSHGPEPYAFERLFCCEEVPPAQAAFIRRACLERVGLGADPTLPTAPDFEMWVRLGLRFPMQHVSGFVAKYRWHTNSGSRRADMVEKLVAARRLVIDRVLDAPDTPTAVRSLRQRAYSGLDMWAAMTASSIGAKRAAWSYAWRGLRQRPSAYAGGRFFGAAVSQHRLGRICYYGSVKPAWGLLKIMKIVRRGL